jgi:hypothetical protein
MIAINTSVKTYIEIQVITPEIKYPKNTIPNGPPIVKFRPTNDKNITKKRAVTNKPIN